MTGGREDPLSTDKIFREYQKLENKMERKKQIRILLFYC